MLRALLAAAIVILIAAAPASAANPWLGDRVMNMAHQGGEDEFPSNTMYAFRKAVRAGADMLELDVEPRRATAARRHARLAVDRTTNGTGFLTDLTLAEVRRLDAAYNFVPGRNAVSGRPARRYPFRGVRTGASAPPRGLHARRLPRADAGRGAARRSRTRRSTSRSRAGDDAEEPSSCTTPDLLADMLLQRTRRRDLIVVSFNQRAVDRFHALVPAVPRGAGDRRHRRVPAGERSPGAGVVALQIPITYELSGQTIEVTTPARC